MVLTKIELNKHADEMNAQPTPYLDTRKVRISVRTGIREIR
jgi:hypothetical protein